MPVMNGLDTTKAIKAAWPRVKGVILTLYVDDQPAALEAGADAFLAKGRSIEEIMSTIHRLN